MNKYEEAIYRIKDHMRVHKLHEPLAVHITESLETAIKACEIAKKDAKYLNALIEIDNHIRSTKEPLPYIIDTIKKALYEDNSATPFMKCEE